MTFFAFPSKCGLRGASGLTEVVSGSQSVLRHDVGKCDCAHAAERLPEEVPAGFHEKMILQSHIVHSRVINSSRLRMALDSAVQAAVSTRAWSGSSTGKSCSACFGFCSSN